METLDSMNSTGNKFQSHQQEKIREEMKNLIQQTKQALQSNTLAFQ